MMRAVTYALLELCELAERAVRRSAELQHEIQRGYRGAAARFSPRETAVGIEPAIPGGMLEALQIAGALGRDTEQLDLHYTRGMPQLLARQLASSGTPEEKLFSARLEPRRMPRIASALEGLFARVADAGLSCETTLGAPTPAKLFARRPTLGALYAGCHFGRSMPMLYATPADVLAIPQGQSFEGWIDARYAGPLAHELAHLQPLDDSRVPAPGNIHESLAAWLGSESFPEQLWPRAKSAQDAGGLDALPGGGFYGSVGAWLARAVGEREATRIQAGALDLNQVLGPSCASALRIYGWLPYLETSAPHLLADTFAPARWWKLIDLHRDPALAEQLDAEIIQPLLSAPPPAPGLPLVKRWNEFLDAIDLHALPAARDPISDEDEKLALRACRALCLRAVRQGGSFRAERVEPPPFPSDEASADRRIFGDGPLRLDLRSCMLRAAFQGADAVGAPPVHPVPPSICAAWIRAGFDELRAGPEGLPRLPSPQ